MSGDWAKAKRQRQISKVLSTTLNFPSIISKVLSTTQDVLSIISKVLSTILDVLSIISKVLSTIFICAKAKQQQQMFSCSESKATATNVLSAR
ncbi:hypothetical protein, partial [Lysinibacillus agricola]|uniref:hypothetical protein n=1 Tax=Lysinibacillus agricola TaxID=2590012 RepID=UPI003C20D1AB